MKEILEISLIALLVSINIRQCKGSEPLNEVNRAKIKELDEANRRKFDSLKKITREIRELETAILKNRRL